MRGRAGIWGALAGLLAVTGARADRWMVDGHTRGLVQEIVMVEVYDPSVLTTGDVETVLSGTAGRLPDSAAVVEAFADVLREGDLGVTVLAPDGDGSGLTNILPDGDAPGELVHLVWDDPAQSWVAGRIVPQGDPYGDDVHLIWDENEGVWVVGRIVPIGDNGSEWDHLIWDDAAQAWVAGRVVPKGDATPNHHLIWDEGSGE